ncbi:UNKNOWN [Stylonychia lemnae]|uniref:tRNA (GuanineN(7))methyltransferase n=1 Tax=Stylonychia lemnae TaxID=5949 RepID=A0A078B9A6_STYLE|nr:UNKNOWN [Stylonychia lemnae]|eukprot:CDW91100.1 UNKNOWN [Stylonychia lemnae]
MNQRLSKQEISRGRYVVNTLHPLSDIPLRQSLPYLDSIRRFFKRNKEDQEKKNLVKDDQMKEEEKGNNYRSAERQSTKRKPVVAVKNQFANMIGQGNQGDLEGAYDSNGQLQPNPKPQFDEDEDPVNYLGFGISSYFQILRTFMFIFFVLSILHLPVMSMYSSHGNFKEETGEKLPLRISLGSMGFSKTKCSSTGMATNKIVLSCKIGVVNRIVDLGINTKFEDKDLCLRNKTGICSSSINYDQLNLDLKSACMGKQQCQLDKLKSYLSGGNQTLTKCVSEDSSFFVQYFCQQTDEQLSVKRQEGAVISAIAVFSCLFFIIMMFYLRQQTQIQKVEWDVETITAGDYTVDLKISQSMYQTFVNQHHQKYAFDPQGYALKKYLKQEIETKLTNEVGSLGFEKVDSIRVADIQFSYKNAPIIHLLNQRGIYIKSNDWESLKKVNQQLDAVKTREYQNLMVAVSAFVTFENEEGYQRFLSLRERGSRSTILGERPTLKEATEPTNIIWENRHFTGFQRGIKAVAVTLIIGILLCISFAIVLALKEIILIAKSKYQTTNCQDLKDNYSDQMLQNYAIQAWYDFYEPPEGIITRTQIQPVLDCFCQQMKSKHSFKVGAQEFTDNENKTTYVCYEWFVDLYLVKAINSVISATINIVNTILKIVLIFLITKIGEDTKSAQIRSIKVGVFVTQFFNTAILLLLSTANFSETRIPILEGISRGQFTDFVEEWYKEIGSIIVKTMAIASIMPVIEFGTMWAFRQGLRMLDRGFTRDFYRSKKQSIQLYVDIYSGPEYLIHLRFSTILNVTFVCFVYGTALPILYPIALWGFFVLYTLERLLVCYYYKQPPALDDKLTNNSLRMLMWAPIVYMMFSYWFLSNNQIFDNILFIKNKVNDITLCGHNVIQDFTNVSLDQSFPCLVMFAILIILIPFGKIFTAIVSLIKPGAFDANLKIDENLGNYFEALEKPDKNWMIQEEENLRKNYVSQMRINIYLQGMKILLEDTIEKLKKAKTVERTIRGVHCYDILANPDYQASFQYVPVDVPNRALIIQDDDEDETNDTIQCDLVRIALNLAMLKEDDAQKLSFEKQKLVQLFKKR